ncbi:MAG: PilT/PilU family type 4a pilus ATPase [Kiritimatiellae bacterium]|nr:PilT/PilU family type 4a pilus ATPase [Kiritimatiellia bacterium]
MAMSEELANIFAQCEATKASDVHLACGEIPRFRMQGQLVPHPAFKRMDAEQVDAIAMELGVETLPVGCPDGTERVRTALLRDGSIDGAITSPSGMRYRFNIYRNCDSTAVALRRLDGEFRSLKELGLPAQLARFCDTPDGLVIVTGPTGSGKSTTLATLIDQINHTRQGHIITLEDPVEFRHVSHRCLVNQRQIGRDARTFHGALVEAMRQDPDVILVGEMRDLATVRTALAASETGHLVFTTLHAGDCAGAVERLVALFPAEEQEGVRRQLALVLRGIFAQHLLPALQGGRVAACELLINTTAVANLIATGRASHIYSAMETGSQIGMVALEQSLADLVAGGRIDEAAAMALTRSPDTLRRRLRLAKGGVNG